MTWLGSNWIWIVFVFVMLAMHFFGHGRHRHRHSDGSDHDRGRGNETDRFGRPTVEGVSGTSRPPTSHALLTDSGAADGDSIVPQVASSPESASADPARLPTAGHAGHSDEARDHRHRHSC